MPPATALCAAGTLRRAARSITRAYDQRLAHAGLTTTQFSILRALERHDAPVPLSVLAEELVFERTSLYRALEPLQRDGVVALVPGPGRVKQASLTPKGVRRIARAMPLWRAAQEAFVSRFGRSGWSRVAAQLVAIAGVAREIPAAEA